MKKELKIILALGTTVVAGLLVAASLYRGSAAKTTSTASQWRGLRQEFVREDSATLGPKDAPVTVVEFLDPECESCKAFFPIMKNTLKKYEGSIYFVVRYMGFHRSSMMAVAATEAAGLQGKYWEMQEHLFATAEEWGHHPMPIRSFFVNYARALGLDVERFQADLNDPKWSQKVQRDMADGAVLGVKATPTVFVNGITLIDLSQEALENSIESALKPKK